VLVALIAGVGLCGGCRKSSDAGAGLRGAVTLDGQALPSSALASVSFQPVKIGAGRATSAQIVDSRYDCPNVPLGTVVAYLHMSIPTGRTFRSERTGMDENEASN
jgi:hypothetical protein